MSSGRRSNAQKRKNSKAGAGARRRGSVPVPPAPVRGSAVGDVIAVLMILWWVADPGGESGDENITGMPEEEIEQSRSH